MFSDRINYKKERILRIIIELKNVKPGTGSGFFINDKGQFLTCFHVIFGGELKNIRKSPDFKSISGNDEHSRLEQWFTNKVNKINVEFLDKSKAELQVERFDERYDIALLKLKDSTIAKKIKYCRLDFKNTLKQGNLVFFGGFPICYPYKNTETPFAINTGMVSSFPETIIGGEKYEHIQINSINLGGNSGAPLFKKNRNRVIGIINGNMNWGSDDVAFIDNQRKLNKGSLRTPLSIAYATSLKLIQKKSKIFN